MRAELDFGRRGPSTNFHAAPGSRRRRLLPGIEEPLGDLLARNGDERAHPRGRRWYGTAIAAPAASRSEKSSSRKPRASPVTSPAMGCSASFVRVVARWAVSSKRSSRKTSSPSLSCHRAVSFLRSSTLCSLATRSATTPAMFHVEGALVGLGQVLQRERTHSRPRLPSRPDALRATSFPCTCAPQKVDLALIARFRPAMIGCFVPVDPTTPTASYERGRDIDPVSKTVLGVLARPGRD